MKLRSSRETVPANPFTPQKAPPTSLDESYTFPAWLGECVWVKVDGKWRHAVVTYDNVCDDWDPRPERWFKVRYNGINDEFAPLYGNMKPDTPQVRELLRKEGYFV